MDKRKNKINFKNVTNNPVGAGLVLARETGITMIALVITIIILLILAGVGISTIIGENGIINEAKQTKEVQKIAEITDKLEMNKVPVQLANFGKVDLDKYLEQIQKEKIIDEYDIEETEEENSRYITVEDKYVYLVEDEENGNVKITYQGKVGALPPRIIDMKATKTRNSIEVEVIAKRVEGAEYKYYLDGKLEGTSNNNTYNYENLETNKEYKVKVEVTTKNGKAEKDITVTTGLLQGEIQIVNNGWKEETHTASVSLSTETEYDIEYQVINNVEGLTQEQIAEKINNKANWIKGVKVEGLIHKDTVYARLTDGVNATKNYATVTIEDSQEPEIEIVQETVGTDRITVKVKAVDREYGLEESPTYIYSIKEGEGSYTEKDRTTNTEKRISGLKQNTAYTVKVEVTDKAGNTGKVEKTFTTGEVEGLVKDGNVTFTVTPNTWTNEDVTVGISVAVSGYTLIYQKIENVSSLTGEQLIALLNNTSNWTEGTTAIVSNNNTTVYARLKDASGNMGNIASVDITKIDKAVPTGVSISAGSVSWSEGTVTLTGKGTDATATNTSGCSGISYYQFSTNGSLTKDSNGWQSITNTKEETTQIQKVTTSGTYYFYVKDEAGNITKSEGVPVTISDTTKPIITAVPNPATWTNGNVTVTVTASDTQSGVTGIITTGTLATAPSLTSGDWRNVTSTTYTITTNGTYYYWAKDAAGNLSVVASVDITKIDKEVPTGVTIEKGNTFWSDTYKDGLGAVRLTGKGTDALSGIVAYQFSTNAGLSAGSSGWIATTNEKAKSGRYETVRTNGTYYFYVKDAAGNVTRSAGTTVTISSDTIKPTLSAVPSTTNWTNGNITVTVTASDTQSGVSGIITTGTSATAPSLTSGDWKNVTSTTYTVTANGTYYYWAKDKSGNLSLVASVNITNIDKTPPTGVTINTSTVSDTYSEKVVLTGKGTDTLSGISYYQFSTNGSLTASSGGWKSITNTKNEITVTEDVATNGTYYFYVKDAAGNVARSNDTTKPTIKATPSTTNWTNGNITVTVEVQDKETGIVGIATTEKSTSEPTNWESVTQTTNKITKTYTIYAKANGTHAYGNGTYYYWVKDAAGNINSASVNVTKIDTAVPTGVSVTSSDVSYDSEGKATVTLTGKGTDTLSGIVAYQFSTNAGLSAGSSGWKSITNTKTQTTQTQKVTASGTYYFYVKDAAGNVTKSAAGTTVRIFDTLSCSTAYHNTVYEATATYNVTGIKKIYYEFKYAHWDTDEEAGGNPTVEGRGWGQLDINDVNILNEEGVGDEGNEWGYVYGSYDVSSLDTIKVNIRGGNASRWGACEFKIYKTE